MMNTKTVIMVNMVPYGSTAKIMVGIANQCKDRGIYPITSTGYSYHPMKELPSNNIKIGNGTDKLVHMMLSRITGMNGCFSYISTKFFLKKLDNIHPELIHLHNIHGWFINIPCLFNYIKKNNIKVIWTLHDCWAFTGRCPHFTMVKCDKWKTGCHHCPYPSKLYPPANIDITERMWKLKKKWFTGVKNMTLVTPSQWLADLVNQSFLKDYSVKVIHNGIDLSVFQPCDSNFRKQYGINNKFIILGIAFAWDRKKGIDVFVELSHRLNSKKYQIVLVGTNDRIDKILPANIISIHRTQNQIGLAEIYTAADLFVNPTREENYPTVNMEALACGTPVLTFRTGGSPEILDETCGAVVDCDDINALENEIQRISESKPFSKEACVERAKTFDNIKRYEAYMDIYAECL